MLAASTALASAGCHRFFACTESSQCTLDGIRGTCEDNGFCSFPDGDCESGQRYGAHASSELVDRCVPDAGASGGGTTTTGVVDDASTGAVSGTTADGASSSGGGCVLTDSDPIVATEAGQVIENLRIAVDAGGPEAIRIEGVQDVIVRNVEIVTADSAGIVVVDSPGVTIQSVSIASDNGEPDTEDDGIRISDSPDAVVEGVRVIGARTQIEVVRSDRTSLRNVHGENPRDGAFVRIGESDDVVLDGFSSVNGLDVSESTPFSLVLIEGSFGAEIRNGLVDGLNSENGHGIHFSFGAGVSADGLVEDVDAVHMTNGAFAGWSADGVTWRRTRCRDNLCEPPPGVAFQGEFSSSGQCWSHYGGVGHALEAAQYFAWTPCDPGAAPQFPTDGYDPLEVTEAEFDARDPIDVVLCWE